MMRVGRLLLSPFLISPLITIFTPLINSVNKKPYRYGDSMIHQDLPKIAYT